MKDFVCEEAPGRVTAKIAADSKYWLYLNGRMTVFEGGLKRGPSPRAAYYDEVDLTGFIEKGNNRIAVLVWYFGKNGFSHVSGARGGFRFEAAVGGNLISSDGTWRVKKNDAYILPSPGETCPNFRLPESDLYYDASLEMGEWYRKDYSVEDWEWADVLEEDGGECIGNGAEAAARTEAGCGFGPLIKRPIPLFRDYGVKDFVNSDSVGGTVFKKDTTVVMRLPYNLQFTPVICVEAPAGKRITVRAEENYRGDLPASTGLKCVYFTREGLQEYESLGWLNGERIAFEIPAGVKIHSLRYRETGYDTQRAGSFHCDDEALNRLWEKCFRTLYLSMRDTFMDCPDRERTQWWGDVNTEMQMLLYCMDGKAALLYEKGVDSLIGWYEATGNMLTVVPSGREQFELPFQNLAGICGFWLYYFHTGNTEFARNVYPMARSYVLRYRLGEDGLVVHRAGSWDWPDGGKHADITVMENAWYSIAVSSCGRLAERLAKDADNGAEERPFSGGPAEKTRYEEDIRRYRRRLEAVRAGMRKKMRQDGIFYDHTDNGRPDDRANALAVLAGFVPKENYGALAELFASAENASPYMEKYVLDALCEMGMVDEAVKRMKKRYAAMVEDDYSTLWERWNRSASLNHAWSGGPLITMSKYVAGISVAEEGGRKYKVRPHPGHLKRIECKVPTKYGVLSVRLTRENGKAEMVIQHPGQITVEAEPPVDETAETDGSVWNIIRKSI